MNKIQVDNITVYYQQKEEAAKDVVHLLEKTNNQLLRTLNIVEPDPVTVRIYDFQTTMQEKKYGYIVHLLDLKWYIGDNSGSNILLTSPDQKNAIHDYEIIKNAVIHELIHAYNHQLNPNLSYWIDNGIAGYFSQQTPPVDLAQHYYLPTLEEIKASHILTPYQFVNYNGYQYSYTFIQFLIEKYSQHAVIQFIRDENYSQHFSTTLEQLYPQWKQWVIERYSKVP